MKTTFEITPIVETVQLQNTAQPVNVAVVPLVKSLCEALEAENIAYCHWKSNDMIKRSANGENDLDLLIDRADGARFAEIVSRLGFKLTIAPFEKQMPAVLDYYGYDPDTDKLIHVHAHFQLIMGHDMTKNFRLPIELPYIKSASQKVFFGIPEIEFEFIVFVIRMMLKHATWDAILGREGKLKASERRELNYLQERMDLARVHEILQRHLPYVGVDLFDRCVKALQPGSSILSRISAAQKLQKSMSANAVYPIAVDVFLKFWRRGLLMVQRRIFRSVTKYQFQMGGALIAILGGDGAGKTTAIDSLYAWLSKTFEITKVHIGKPAWSPITVTIRSLLKIGQLLGLYPLETSYEETLEQKSLVSPGYPFLIREVCRARDRYQTYLKARRFAAKGGLVLLDRFPRPEIKQMDGLLTERFIRDLQAGAHPRQFLRPSMDSRFARFLIRLEESYYYRISPPELMLVLRVPPEVAVERKTDEDPAMVRARSTEMWNINWEQTDVQAIDSNRPKEDVLGDLKAVIWSRL